MNKLFIMIGIPGSGKSTFAKQYLQDDDTLYISRDDIRYSLLKEGDKYFKKEDEVFRKFGASIQDGLKKGYNVIADATHLTPQARLRLINRVDLKHIIGVEVDAIFMDTPYEICLARNDKRHGTKTYVPITDMNDMNNAFVAPTFEENDAIFDKIYIVDSDYNVTIKMRKEQFNNEIFYV